MDQRIKRSLISAARRLSISWGPRQSVKRRSKVAPATHECSRCGSWNYEGKSLQNYAEIKEQNPDKVVHMESIKIDHIVPVVDPTTGRGTWDEFFERLFCGEENLRPICKFCHNEKSRAEKAVRNASNPKKGKKK